MSQSALLARRFQQNWLDKYPQNSCQNGINLDDSLTSLGWLQNLRVSEFAQARPASSLGAKLGSDNVVIKSEFSPGTEVKTLSYGSTIMGTEHKANPYVKPPYSYASLIYMAMKATKKNKITLSSIYNWITDNFVYYRHSDPSWQNSIRHNLSLNKCFEKVARGKDEPGKGGFWRINPEYCDLMENGVVKRRHDRRDTCSSPLLKRIKLENDDTTGGYNIMGRAREDKLLSTCSSDIDTSDENSENSLTLKGDLSWTTIMNQDIEIGGKIIKTLDILDEYESSSFVPLSPPSSETNSDHLGLDFLSQADFGMNLSSDFQTTDPLDLTVQGTTIRPPEWWTADDNSTAVNIENNSNSGLNTPVPTSPELEQGDIIWGEKLKLGSSGSSFDLDSLFAFERIPTST